MSEMFQRLDKSFFQGSKEVGDLINKENFEINNSLIALKAILSKEKR